MRGTLHKTEELGCTIGTRFSSKISAPSYVSEDGENPFTTIRLKVVSIAVKLLNQLTIFCLAVVEA